MCTLGCVYTFEPVCTHEYYCAGAAALLLVLRELRVGEELCEHTGRQSAVEASREDRNVQRAAAR